MVYQEQVMQISMKMSGFTAGESDKVRKAVAKKKIKLMQEVVQHWDDGTDETMEANSASRVLAILDVLQSKLIVSPLRVIAASTPQKS